MLLEVEILAFFRKCYTLHSHKVAHKVHSYFYVLYSVKSVEHEGLSRFDLIRQESDGSFNSQSVLWSLHNLQIAGLQKIPKFSKMLNKKSGPKNEVSKGQLISEANFKVFIWTKNGTKIFLQFYPTLISQIIKVIAQYLSC